MSYSIRTCKNFDDLKLFANSNQELELVNFPFNFKREHWIVERNNQIIGRISACISSSEPTRGYIGFYQRILNDPEGFLVGALLLKTSEQWLKDNNIKEIIGPINYSTWFNYRFQVESTLNTNSLDTQFEWEPKPAIDYYSDWIKNDYFICENYNSKAYSNIEKALKPTEGSYLKLISLGYKTRPIQMSEFPVQELKTISNINENSFTDHFLVEPIEPLAYQELYAKPFMKYISEYCFFILNPEGKEIGYSFSFEDQNYLIWKTMAIKKDYQGKGLATLVINHTLQLAQKNGLSNMVAALMRQGAPSEILLNKISTPLWTHHYSLLKKSI